MMMRQQTPPSRFNTLMEKIGWTLINSVIGGFILFLLTKVWLGNIIIVNFTWFMLLFGAGLLIIALFVEWCFLRATRKYQEDIAALQQKNYAFEDQTTRRVNQELDRLNNLFIALSQDAETKQKERFEELKKHCMEAISDAKNALDGRIMNTETNFVGAIKSYERALDSQKQYLLDVMQSKLEEMLTTRQLPNEQEAISNPSQGTYNGI